MAYKPIVCWDLDSTIADTYHRQPMIEKIKAGDATWDDYSLASDGDTPIAGTVTLMRLLGSGCEHHIVSGRSEAATAMTILWLDRHGIRFDAIKLRAAGDFTENGLLKVAYIRQLHEIGRTVALYVEDWPPAAELIHQMTGVPVLVVDPCYPPDAPARVYSPIDSVGGGL